MSHHTYFLGLQTCLPPEKHEHELCLVYTGASKTNVLCMLSNAYTKLLFKFGMLKNHSRNIWLIGPPWERNCLSLGSVSHVTHFCAPTMTIFACRSLHAELSGVSVDHPKRMEPTFYHKIVSVKDLLISSNKKTTMGGSLIKAQADVDNSIGGKFVKLFVDPWPTSR